MQVAWNKSGNAWTAGQVKTAREVMDEVKAIGDAADELLSLSRRVKDPELEAELLRRIDALYDHAAKIAKAVVDRQA